MGSDGMETPETEEEGGVSKSSITNSMTQGWLRPPFFIGFCFWAVVTLLCCIGTPTKVELAAFAWVQDFQLKESMVGKSGC
jgi:hypothetical protein